MLGISKANSSTGNFSIPKVTDLDSKKLQNDKIEDKVTISYAMPQKLTLGEKIGGVVMGTVMAGIKGTANGIKSSVDGAIRGSKEFIEVGFDVDTDHPKFDKTLTIAGGIGTALLACGSLGPIGIPLGFAMGAGAGAYVATSLSSIGETNANFTRLAAFISILPTAAGALKGSFEGLAGGIKRGIIKGWQDGNQSGRKMVRLGGQKR